MSVRCVLNQVEETLGHLREAGRSSRECVVLWLARRDGADADVVEVYRPLQNAEEDMFRIPPEGMTALQARQRERRVMVAAQIHSHPGRAFHSRADDRWAIIRHEGALSLVVPDFAARTPAERFLADTKVYQFSATGHWVEVPPGEVQPTWLQIT